MALRETLFVAGVARSGTSALAKLLSAHPAIVVGMERYFKLACESRYQELDASLFKPARFLSPIEDETHNFSWGGDTKYRNYIERKLDTARIIGDKVPNYFCYADHLFAGMPSSRMLLITREPMGVANSWKSRMLDPEDRVWDAGADRGISHWISGHRIMLNMVRKYPKRMGVVVYEDLFSGDDATFHRLLDWLNAGPANRWMLDYHQSETAGWRARQEQKPVLNEEECRMVETSAVMELRQELIDRAGI